MLEFETKNQMKSYTQHCRDRIAQGETAHVKSNDKIYVFNYDWTEVKVEGDSGIKMSVYDINEQLIKQLPDLTEEQIQEKKKLISDFIKTEVYMLLCKEQSYYTVFLLDKSDEKIEDAVIDCVLCDNTHSIRSIDNIEDKEIEIWAMDEKDNAWCYHLFDYTEGLIHCGR